MQYELSEENMPAILPTAVYSVSHAARLVQKSSSTLYRALRNRKINASGSRIVGESLLEWVRRGCPTGRNKGHVREEMKRYGLSKEAKS